LHLIARKLAIAISLQGEALNDDSGAFALSRFVEKPNRETAESYLAAGDYRWNSGIFVMKASAWPAVLAIGRPDILGM